MSNKARILFYSVLLFCIPGQWFAQGQTPDPPTIAAAVDWTTNVNRERPANPAVIQLPPVQQVDSISWIRKGVVLDLGPEGSYDDRNIESPIIWKNADGTYLLLYRGMNKRDKTGRIMRATSKDGLVWTKTGVVMVPEKDYEGSKIDPMGLAFENGEFVLWYGAGARGGSACVATSPDGVTWTRSKSNPVLLKSKGKWDSSGAGGHHTVVRTPDGYRMIYKGLSSKVPGWTFYGAASSADGIEWIKDRRVISPQPKLGDSSLYRNLFAFRHGSDYFLAHSMSKHLELYLLHSPDALEWTRKERFFRKGLTPGGFDKKWATSPFIMIEDGRVRMWYEGGDGKGRVRILYAETSAASFLATYGRGEPDLGSQTPPTEGAVKPKAVAPVNRLLYDASKSYTARLHFGSGVTALFDGGKQDLQPIVDDWRDAKSLMVYVDGHVAKDDGLSGLPDAPREDAALSRAQAQAIGIYLAEQLDVPGDRVTVVGHGADRPFVPVALAEGRGLNRRVDVRIIGRVANPNDLLGANRDTTFSRGLVRFPANVEMNDSIGPLGLARLDLVRSSSNVKLPKSATETVNRVRSEMAAEWASEEQSGDHFSRFLDRGLSEEDQVIPISSDVDNTNWYSTEREALRWKPGIWSVPEIKKARDRRARRTNWSTMFTGSLSGAYDSNIYGRPADEASDGIVESGVRADVRRYLSDKDQVRFWATATAAPHLVSSAPDEFVGRVGVKYRRQLSKIASANLLVETKRENDDVVNTEGEDVLRDFGHMLYRVQPSVHVKLGSKNVVWFYYVTQRKDFRDQSDLHSLDWWQHGPSVKWRSALGPNANLEVDYTARIHQYDEAIATSRSGTLLESNPTEKHLLMRFDVDTFWRATSSMEWRFGYCFERKDDRFEDYESWSSHCVRSEVTRILLSRITLRGAVLFENRNYDQRPADGDARLKYNRLHWETAVGVRLSQSFTLFTSLSNSSRITNRSIGNDYRNFDILRIATGLSFTL